jgi:hypothetical protein
VTVRAICSRERGERPGWPGRKASTRPTAVDRSSPSHGTTRSGVAVGRQNQSMSPKGRPWPPVVR